LQNVRIRRYLNQTSRPIPDLSQTGVNFIDPVNGINQVIQPRWLPDTSRRDTQGIDGSDFKYALASVNAKFLKDRLVVLGAVRRDTYKFVVEQQLDKGDYPLDWDGLNRILRPSAPADYDTLTYQPLTASGAPDGPKIPARIRPRDGLGNRDPRYVDTPFQDDYNVPPLKGSQVTRSVGSVLHLHSWFNPSFNYAETFNPPTSSIITLNGTLLPASVAKGKDYGVRMELFKNRLSLNFIYYEAAEEGAQTAGDGPPGINTLLNANIIGDQSTTGINARGVPPVPVIFRDTRSRVNQGVEGEFTWNPTKAIRITGNYSKPKTGAGSQYPITLAYIAEHRSVLKQIAQDAGVLIDAADVASVDNSIPINNRSPDVQAAANAYNSLVQFVNTNTGALPALGESPESANFFADYTFQEGWVKRLRVGAGIRWRGKRALGNRANDTIVN
ncbi:MAG: TonB-dependent receptor domain-containing protein, partial [Opitutaceae bacterium]